MERGDIRGLSRMSLRSCGLQGVPAEMAEGKKKRPISSYAMALSPQGRGGAALTASADIERETQSNKLGV
jgi:hypothetical protein